MRTVLIALGVLLLAGGCYAGWLAWMSAGPQPIPEMDDNFTSVRITVVASATAAVLVLSAVLTLLASIRVKD